MKKISFEEYDKEMNKIVKRKGSIANALADMLQYTSKIRLKKTKVRRRK